ncbi:MAG: type VII secretion protein EssC [Peptococcaceae bacterium]|nr:type VII secretion protein EssC [Peptococcaceae bacterium]
MTPIFTPTPLTPTQPPTQPQPRIPTLVAEYNNVRYQCQLTPDKTTYTVNDPCEADFTIPRKSDHPFLLGLHAILAEFTEEGTLQNLVAVIGSQCQIMETEPEVITTVEDISFHIEYPDPAQTHIYLETETIINFGRNEKNKVILSRCKDDYTLLIKKDLTGTWMLHAIPGQDVIHINNRNFKLASRVLEPGDTVRFAGYRLEMADEYITLYHQNAYRLNNLIEYEPGTDTDPTSPTNIRYPNFQRPPRILYPVPGDKITIPNPPGQPRKDRFGLLVRLAPILAMIAMMIVMSLLRARGIYMLAMVGVMAVTATVTTYRYFADKKHRKQEETERVTYYETLLNRKRKEIRTLIDQQSKALEHTYPNPQTCVALAEQISPRLWERTRDYVDFFRLRIGTNEQPLTFTIEHTPQETAEAEQDPLHQDAEKLAQTFENIPDLPQSISLTEAYVGIVGPSRHTIPHALSLIGHLCVFHSYNDLTLIVIYPEAREQDFLPFKWLPHTWLGERQFKGMVNETTRNNILDSLINVLKERETDHAQNTKKIYQPIVFLVADLNLMYNHDIRKYLTLRHQHLGVHAIFLTESPYALPESVKTILTLTSDDTLTSPTEATIYQETDPTPRTYKPDTLTPESMEKIARALAPLNHVRETTDKDMPETVTLLELLRAETVSDLDIEGQWETNKPYKTLAVPIGLRSADKIIELDLHEKAHGPHGLLAGTTGSGKSETLQSYILSLAIHFHPQDVAFLLIDYKGGGMSNLFDDLPHLLGTITNLDGAGSMRALVAIKNELRRRQAVLADHEVNHIDAYQKKREQTPTLAPMPHLFIISDEFAELKREKPDFIKELVSAARIGRSLGVHMILATQKPSGVVDDQIWSNSNFRVCLKVQNPGDSQEMLKTPDAAHITLPGRGYLQVGNNIIYEQFQSAYTGAEYRPDKTESEDKPDSNIYLWNQLGQAQLITRDFSATTTGSANRKTTELEAVTDAINQTFQAKRLTKVPSPWLPPLRDNLCLAEIIAIENGHITMDQWGVGNYTLDNTAEKSASRQWTLYGKEEEHPIKRTSSNAPLPRVNCELEPSWAINPDTQNIEPHRPSPNDPTDPTVQTDQTDQTDIKITIGVVDEIEHQRQTLLTLNFTADGHTGIWGSSGTGKSTCLHTIALALALRCTPSQAHYYILDFGNNNLLTLQTLPHTADIVTLEDGEKLIKLEHLLQKEIKRRKETLGTSRVPTITLHNRIRSDSPIPAIFLFIDNIDCLKDPDNIDMENLIKDIARDGQALSIYLIFTSSRSAMIKPAILGSIKTRLLLHTIDPAELYALLGRTDLPGENIPGRGLTTLDTICSFQAALPVPGQREEDRLTTFRQTMETIRSDWTGPMPPGIPMMPETVSMKSYYRMDSVRQALQTPDKKLPIALDNENIEAFNVDFSKISHLLVTGAHNTGKTNIIKIMLESLTRKNRPFNIHIIDDPMFKLSAAQNMPETTYLTQKQEIIELTKSLAEEVVLRKDGYARKMRTQATTQSLARFCAGMTPYITIVNNLSNLMTQLTKPEQEDLGQLLSDAQSTGIHFCFVSNIADFPKSYDKLAAALKSINTGFTLTPLDQPGQILPIPPRANKYNPPRPGEAYHIQAGAVTLVKFPLVSAEDNF